MWDEFACHDFMVLFKTMTDTNFHFGGPQGQVYKTNRYTSACQISFYTTETTNSAALQ